MLSQRSDESLDRELLIAFSLLHALKHYYPSSVTPEAQRLIDKFSWVRDREPSRLLKQRRIAISKILMENFDFSPTETREVRSPPIQGGLRRKV